MGRKTAFSARCFCCLVSFLLLNFGGTAGADSTLSERLNSPAQSAALDALTRSAPTLNKVTLLQYGKTSWPLREQLVKNASRYVFVSVPYWFKDATGGAMADILRSKETFFGQNRFEYKVIEDWISPFFGHGSRSVESELGDHLLFWNSPLWQRNFSLNFKTGHLHEKMLVVDGEKMFVGGMNMTDQYLTGGETSSGFHDTDVLLEGPAAQKGAEIFLKLWRLGNYLKSSLSFPPFRKEEVNAFQSYFYKNQEDHDFYTTDVNPPFRIKNRVHIPINDVLSDPFYFPPLKTPSGQLSSVRLIYDSPLIDRDAATGRSYSKTKNTIKYLLSQASESAWFFMPYLTLDQEMFDALVEAAKRIKVVIITNSRDTWDVPAAGYKAQVAHYGDLLKAGVHLYEWQGDGPIWKAISQGCTLQSGEWAGQTLHSKVALFDGQVALIGSNNMNHQSLDKNDEIMALINDPRIGEQVKDIFLNDLEAGRSLPSPVTCKDPSLVPVETVAVDANYLSELIQKYNVGAPSWSYPLGF